MATVGELRKALEGLDDSIPLLISSFDHSYRLCAFSVSTARKDGRNYTEDFGEDQTPTDEYGPAVPAVVFE